MSPEEESQVNEEETPLEKLAAEPAVLLDEAIQGVDKFRQQTISKKPFKVAEEYWNTLGPGLTTGASDDDPAGIATYSQMGAQFGFQLAWLSWITFPLMAVVQEMCARIGIVTGHGLAANIRRRYPRWVLYVVTAFLFAANTFNIGADLGAMAQSAQLLLPDINFAILIIAFAAVTLALQIFTTYARYAKYLKYLAFVLLAYIVSAILSNLNWHDAFTGLIPTIQFSKSQLYLICAVLGTTISPYLFFWQTSQEVEQENLEGKIDESSWRQEVASSDLGNMRSDVWSGMFLSNLIMFFIVVACAGTLFVHGVTNIQTAAQAANALRPFAGDAAYLLFAIGILGTGMLAIPVLAGSTSYAISESFGWKHGLYRKLKEAYAFYGVIILSILIGIALNFVGLNPIQALIYSAVANGLVAPLVLYFIVRLSSDKSIMQEHANKSWVRIVGWLAFALMLASGAAAIISIFF